ncbi:MAG: hypothetical protein HC915_21530 [Anaerolineae bacterium]|nr:hypothetical protein [Anaerolineae bacterium]
MFSAQESALLFIIAATFALILSGRWPVELVATLVLLTLAFSGLVTTQQALSGFSSAVVIVLVGLFVITRALEETGVIHWLARRLNAMGQGAEGAWWGCSWGPGRCSRW